MGITRPRDEIAHLDPERDCQRIVHLLACHEFPFDLARAGELALFRTFGIPSISKLLDATGEFAQRPRRRYDDTDLILSEIIESGYDSERGRAVLRRLNHIHGHYAISNDDFLYVLSTFIFEGERWVDTFGWRRFTERERQAGYAFWREVGRRMGITAIPADHEAFAAWVADYERRHLRFAETNRRVAAAALDGVLAPLPRPLRPLAGLAVRAVMEGPLLDASGHAARPGHHPGAGVGGVSRAGGGCAAAACAAQAGSAHAATAAELPQGYEVEGLGPPGMG